MVDDPIVRPVPLVFGTAGRPEWQSYKLGFGSSACVVLQAGGCILGGGVSSCLVQESADLRDVWLAAVVP